MGLKQSKRSFEVTADTPKKEAPAVETLDSKEVVPTNGDVPAADGADAQTAVQETTGDGKQNGGAGDTAPAENGTATEENGETEKEAEKVAEKTEEKKEKVKKKRSFRSFSFLRREKKHKDVKEKEKAKNGDAKVEAETKPEEKAAEEAPAATDEAKSEETPAPAEEAKEGGDSAPAAEVN